MDWRRGSGGETGGMKEDAGIEEEGKEVVRERVVGGKQKGGKDINERKEKGVEKTEEEQKRRE